MQAILRLIPDHRIRRIHQPGADLLAAVGRQAVHVKGVARGPAHQFGIHLVGREQRRSLLLLTLLAHGGPHIGHHQVYPRGRGRRVVLYADPVAVLCQQLAIGFETRWAGDGQLEVELPRRIDIGLAHIIAVPHPAGALALDTAPVFHPGLHIRQQLAGMVVIGQGVDHRYRRMSGETLHDVVPECADHHDVHHGGDHPGAVLNRFPAAKLRVLGRQEHGVTTQLCHAHLEGHPGTGGGLGENHCQYCTGEAALVVPSPVFLLHVDGALDQVLQFRWSEIQ